jgi:hypothetical protein
MAHSKRSGRGNFPVKQAAQATPSSNFLLEIAGLPPPDYRIEFFDSLWLSLTALKSRTRKFHEFDQGWGGGTIAD